MTSTTPQFAVFVVDDDAAIRRALSILLAHEGYEVTTYGSAETFLGEFDPTAYGCIVLDVKMPGIEGMELQERLVEIGADQPIIFVTGHASVPLSVTAIKRGAVDFLEKPFRRKVLIERIKEAQNALDARHRRNEAIRSVNLSLEELTQRELDVFRLLVGAKPIVSSKEIAQALSISPRTADQHRANVLTKMQVHSVGELGVMLARAEFDLEAFYSRSQAP